MTFSEALIDNHGNGPQNVKTGDGPQYNNNDKGTQFINCTFYGSMTNSPQDMHVATWSVINLRLIVEPKDTNIDEVRKLKKGKEGQTFVALASVLLSCQFADQVCDDEQVCRLSILSRLQEYGRSQRGYIFCSSQDM